MLIAYSHPTGTRTLDLSNQELKSFKNAQYSQAPAWHHPGRQLIVGQNELFLLNLEKSDIARLSEEGLEAIFPAGHPSLPIIAYSVRTAHGLSIALHHLETAQKCYLPIPFYAFQVDWHPNGQEIAFVGIINQEKHIFKANIADYLNDFQSKLPLNYTQLTQTGKFNHAPAWNHQGNKIAFEQKLETGQWSIMVMDSDGQNLQALSPQNVEDHHPSWSPDDNYLAFERSGPGAGIFIMQSNGSKIWQLTNDNGTEPTWVNN